MNIHLDLDVESDGCVGLRWRPAAKLDSIRLLIIRTGAVPSYTSLQLGGETERYQINNLSRHQRYRLAVLGTGGGSTGFSGWVDITPRAGLEPVRVEESPDALASCVAGVDRLMVMPQSARLTAYWGLSAGFVDRVVLEVLGGDGRQWRRLELEPEVRSISLDRSRGVSLTDGNDYAVRVTASFAGLSNGHSPAVSCTPASQGEERRANSKHPQQNLLYPSLAVSPELRIFPDDEACAGDAAPGGLELVCCHCRQRVEWQDYRLACAGCGAEFIPNGRGDFLEVARLRFGTCRCCLPRKILVQKPDSAVLTCAHSGKEHIRMPGEAEASGGFLLIEDLPHGLCQCCRPRRPLVRNAQGIVCGKSGECHRNENGQYVLIPSEPVFDAAAIDELLDAGLAEICSTGVSRGAARAARRSS
jgi:hypothetical protein